MLYYNTTAFPLGVEKQMFDAFQLTHRHGVVAADYDCLVGQWPVTGLRDYVLAKAFSDPSKPFEYWEDHDCSAYGATAEEAKAYFRYWRHELWEKRLLPDLGKLVEKGRFPHATEMSDSGPGALQAAAS